jgi:ubiquinone/menaquinone biosynthesis C-methylase UbiE
MHKFLPDNAQRLERPERYRLIPPDETLRRFGLRTGMRFLDFGAGTGYFSRPAARIVGPTGRVYAVDMSREMLEVLQKNGVNPPMEIHLSREYAIPLPDGSADVALLAFVLHENVDRGRLLDEVMRVLTQEGRLILIEWTKQDEEQGPPREERLGEEDLRIDLRKYRLIEEGSLNESHYYKIVSR